MIQINKSFILASCAAIVVMIFIFASRSSSSRSLKQDLFPNGYPSHIDFGSSYNNKNVTWILLGQSKIVCRDWAIKKDWSEVIAWRKSYADPSSAEKRIMDFIFNKHKINAIHINSVYSGLIDHSDVGYLIVLDRPVDGKYYGIVCVVRS